MGRVSSEARDSPESSHAGVEKAECLSLLVGDTCLDGTPLVPISHNGAIARVEAKVGEGIGSPIATHQAIGGSQQRKLVRCERLRIGARGYTVNAHSSQHRGSFRITQLVAARAAVDWA